MSDAPDFRVPAPGGERDSARPRFYVEAVHNPAASAEKGQPVFFEREMVHILIPGDRLSEWTGIVSDVHKRRWPAEYAAWKAAQDPPSNGTPIDQLPAITKAQAEELKFSHIKTIEDLAALPDGALNKSVSIGGFTLRDKAKRWLEAAAGAAPNEKLAAENADLKARMAAMEAQLADLAKRQDERAAQAAQTAPVIPPEAT